VTEAQIAEAVRLVKPDDGDNDVLRQIVGKSLVQCKLKELGKDNIGEKRLGFEIGTSSEDDIDNRAEEEGVVLSDAIWHRINADIHILERNACDILRKNDIYCQPEGHGDNNLSGSAWLKSERDQTQTVFLPSQKALDMLLTWKSGNLSTYDSRFLEFDPDNSLWKGVSKFGKKFIDVSIRFFDVEELKIDDWEEVLQEHPEVWGKVSEAKEYLDFNTLLGPPVENKVHVKNVNGTPIFSVRCPGCKRIHGNFRTFDEASANQQCKYCTRDYVDMMLKANETGQYKHLLKKREKRVH
jgi:ribosomal protein S27E